jgi:hypothetical protein
MPSIQVTGEKAFFSYNYLGLLIDYVASMYNPFEDFIYF